MSNPLLLELPPELIDKVAALVEERLAERERREYMDSALAATYLAMSRGRLDKLCAGAISTAQPIPYVPEGRRRLFVRQDLDRWLDTGGSSLA